jgi:hypothetical protein
MIRSRFWPKESDQVCTSPARTAGLGEERIGRLAADQPAEAPPAREQGRGDVVP